MDSQAHNFGSFLPEHATAAFPLNLLESRLRGFAPGLDLSPVGPAVRGARTFTKDQPVWARQESADSLIVIEEGFAFTFRMMRGGRRHIEDLFGPGSICNWPRFEPFDERDDIHVKGGTRTALIDRSMLTAAMGEDPQLAGAFKRQELARQMRTAQRARALITLPAPERLLMVMLDLHDELAASRTDDGWLPMPLTQQELADLVGLTGVHVSRTLSRLEERGDLQRGRHEFRIPDLKSARHSLDYRSFFAPRPGWSAA